MTNPRPVDRLGGWLGTWKKLSPAGTEVAAEEPDDDAEVLTLVEWPGRA
ncbi:MAG: hypothetical protein ACRDZ8_21210 [Acidimicrobiales bacterium]